MRQYSPYHRANHLLAQVESPAIILRNLSDRFRIASVLPIEPRNPERIPWWLWWNVLSIDAPTVAIVWAVLFARVTAVRLSAVDLSILTLAVWIIYVSDRLLDGWATPRWSSLQKRHYFCARHRGCLICLLLTAAGTILWLAGERLPSLELSAGFKVGVSVATYMVGVHVRRALLVRLLPKEVIAGMLFALGTTLPVWSRSWALRWDVWALFTLFGLLCSLNCLAIECWEGDSRGDTGRYLGHPLVTWGSTRINHLAVVVFVCGLAGFVTLGPRQVSSSAWFAICLSALLMLLLNIRRKRISPEGLRVLADVALVIPVLIALAG